MIRCDVDLNVWDTNVIYDLAWGVCDGMDSVL